MDIFENDIIKTNFQNKIPTPSHSGLVWPQSPGNFSSFKTASVKKFLFFLFLTENMLYTTLGWHHIWPLISFLQSSIPVICEVHTFCQFYHIFLCTYIKIHTYILVKHRWCNIHTSLSFQSVDNGEIFRHCASRLGPDWPRV